jgi:hypothetical protein
MYLEDTTKIISSIVDHWKDIDKKKKAMHDEKTLLVKEAIWKYLKTRCFGGEFRAGKDHVFHNKDLVYMFDPKEFVTYFNNTYGKDFKINDVPSKTVRFTHCYTKTTSTENISYEVSTHVDTNRNGFVYSKLDDALHRLLTFLNW